MKRSFRDVHRDFWRLLAANPLVFVVLPVLVFLPVDLLVGLVTQEMKFGEALKAGMRIQQVASVILGTYLASVILWTVRAMTDGKKPGFGASLSGGRKYWGAVSITSFHSGLRIGLGLLALIVPGIILLVRYAFTLPITVFEDVHGRAALERSKEQVRGSAGRVFAMFSVSMLVYFPLMIVLSALPSTTSPEPLIVAVFEALGSIPINAALACMTVGTAVAYMEIMHPEKLQAALNASPASQPGMSQPVPAFSGAATSSGLPWPLLIGAGSWGGAVAAFYLLVGIGTIPLAIGGYYSEQLNAAKAREYFDMAIRFEPESFDVRFGVGAHLLNSEDQGDEVRALEELKKAAELRPDYGEAHLYLAAAYLVNGDYENGRAALSKAEELGVTSTEYLNTLKAHLEMSGEYSEDEG